MTKLDLTQLTEEDLLIEQKKRKSTYTSLAFIIGMMFGIAIYSFIKKGFGFFTFFPLFFVFLLAKPKTDYDEIKKEIASRK